MPRFTLISHHLCPYVQRAVIVLAEKRVPYERIDIDLANKPDWFLALSPLGRTPVLQADGAVVFESQVIAEYLDEITDGSLHPDEPLERARHRSWIEFGSGTLAAIAGYYNAPAESFADERAALRAKFARIEREVALPFFAGERFSMIDGVWGTVFRYLDAFEMFTGDDLLDGLPGVRAWRAAVRNRPSVAGAAGVDYPARLIRFLARRPSEIGGLAAAYLAREGAGTVAAAA